MEAGYPVSKKKAQIYRGRKVAGVCFKEGLKVPDPNCWKMLEIDKCSAPAVDGSRLPGVEEEGTDLQRT